MTITINDHAHVFDSSALADLQGRSWPFDLHVGTGAFGSRAELDTATGHLVDGPRVVAIGLDPGHHFVSVHFGSGLGVPYGAREAIVAAGKPSFRDQQWSAGVVAIGAQTQAAMGRAEVSIAPRTVVVQESSGGPILAGVLVGVGAAIAVLVFFAWRAHRREEQRALERALELEAELAARRAINDNLDDFDRRLTGSAPPRSRSSVQPARPAQPRIAIPGAPSVSPVIVSNNGGSSDGFVNGLLVGELLSDRDLDRSERARRYDSGGEAVSFGSDSSSVDSGGDSSSFDSGGETSDWGGGSDGGGFDSGGSGGDF